MTTKSAQQPVVARLYEGRSAFYRISTPGLRYWVVLPLGEVTPEFRAYIRSNDSAHDPSLQPYVVLEELGALSPVHQHFAVVDAFDPFGWRRAVVVISPTRGIRLFTDPADLIYAGEP